MCESEHWFEPPARVECMFSDGSTKIVEDACQRARFVEDRRQANKTVSPQIVWFSLIQRRVASSVHRFPEADFQKVPDRVAVTLPKVPDKKVYLPRKAKTGLDLHSFVSTKVPDW